MVMLTVSQADKNLFGALRAGARGHLLKDIDPSRLAEALRGVLAGEAALPRTLAARLMEKFLPGTPRPSPPAAQQALRAAVGAGVGDPRAAPPGSVDHCGRRRRVHH